MHEIVIVVFILMPQVSPKSEEYRNLFRLPQDEVSELKILFFFFSFFPNGSFFGSYELSLYILLKLF